MDRLAPVEMVCPQDLTTFDRGGRSHQNLGLGLGSGLGLGIVKSQKVQNQG